MREGVVTGVDSFTKLTGDGAGGTLQDITVPTWANSIKHIAITAGVDGAAALGNILVKLSGATKFGDQILPMLGHSNIGTTVGIAGEKAQQDVDIPVIPGKSLELYGCFAGGDTGSPELGVQVTFSEKQGSHRYVTRQAAPTTADVWMTLNTENGTTAVNDHITQGSKIDQIWVVAAYGATTQEPLAVYARIQGVGGCIAGNEHTFCGPSYMVSDGTLADCALFEPMKYDVDIACTPGTVRVQAVSSGATITTDPEVAVCVVYQV
jgi:hypothetical protein